MATNIDEYNPNSKQGRFQIQNSDREYIYNNVRSCIAIAITDTGGNNMIGVHFSIATKNNNQELTDAVAKMKQMLRGQAGGIYIIGPYTTIWKDSLLKAKLQTISHNIFCGDVAGVNKTNNGADVDVKMEALGTQVKGYVKPLNGNNYMAVSFKPL